MSQEEEVFPRSGQTAAESLHQVAENVSLEKYLLLTKIFCSISEDGAGDGAGSGSKTGSPGQVTPRSANMSRRGSAEPNSEAMEALRQFQMKNSKSYKNVAKPAAENLGVALKMIKKRRSLFEHGNLEMFISLI